MLKFNKTEYEEFYRTHEFLRTDGKGWLATGETITTASVIIIEKDSGIDKSSAMVSNVAPYGSPQTQVKYFIQAGSKSVKNYFVEIRVVTSTSQKFEDVLLLEVT